MSSESQRFFAGFALVRLHDLRADSGESGFGLVAPKNVARLIEVFRTEGCHRRHKENFVTALVGRQQLDDALLHNGVQHCELKDVEEPPHLTFPATVPVLYIRGRHRLAAAEEFLEPTDRWWTAELYFQEIPSTAKAYLREHQDRDLVESLMEDRVIFPNEGQMEMRDEITRAILTIPTLIVTLRTFFDDIKYLQPVVLSLKRLFPRANHLSLRDAVRKSYVVAHADHGQVYVENAENVGQRLSLPYEKHVDSGYLQLLLYIWRHFPEITSVDTKKSRASRPTNNAYRPGVRRDGGYHCRWINLAKLAATLGFDNEEIRRLKAQDPDIEVICRNLLQLRPKHLFEIEPHSFDLEVNRQLEALVAFSRRPIYLNYPEINTDHDGPPPSARCGKPDQTSQDLDKCYMFLQNVTRRQDHPLRKSITSFAVNA
ncbi:hypothetical protein LTS18_001997 [Coniosporium uncinatum]|uniref:Uncharacterized protein n=1 Tax=Coniosporium uncinatum TaxID=93489 RepID=A0ACC3DZ58_9PEZI|nr:hypothetical protein LTS18_001997 [Coniosporium uncinatum]